MNEPRLAVETITDAGVFERLSAEWRDLLADSDADTLFLTWEWLHTWWRHLGASSDLEILAVRRGSRLVGIAPFVRSSWSLRARDWSRPLRFLAGDTIGSDYLDLILRRDEAAAALQALASHLRARGRAVHLRQTLDHPGCAASRLADALAARRFRTSSWPSNVCPYVSLSGRTWPGYLATLGGEHRRGLERKLRGLAKAFAVRFERVDDPDRLDDAMSTLRQLHHLRWNDRGGGTEAFTSRGFDAFHEEFSRRALRLGWLRLHILHLDEKPVAALYGFAYRGVFFFYQSGFDPAYARYGVGVVMMGLSIRSALEEGLSEFDLLHGAEPYKLHWTRVSRTLVERRADPPGLAGALCASAARWDRSTTASVRRLLSGLASRKVAHAR